MTLRLKHTLRRFAASESGGMSVEAVIIFPILLWAFIAMFVFWDAFKSQNINLKATYTIADMISREDGANTIDEDYIDGANDVYGFLTGNRPDNETRVSVVSVGLASDGITPELNLEWSESSNEAAMPGFNDIAQIEDRLPILSVGDQLIVVETQVLWEPVMERVPLVGSILTPRTMTELVFTSPRFLPQIIWEGA